MHSTNTTTSTNNNIHKTVLNRINLINTTLQIRFKHKVIMNRMNNPNSNLIDNLESMLNFVKDDLMM